MLKCSVSFAYCSNGFGKLALSDFRLALDNMNLRETGLCFPANGTRAIGVRKDPRVRNLRFRNVPCLCFQVGGYEAGVKFPLMVWRRAFKFKRLVEMRFRLLEFVPGKRNKRKILQALNRGPFVSEASGQLECFPRR